MEKRRHVIIALAVIAVGALVAPFVAQRIGGFEWQRHASAYVAGETIYVLTSYSNSIALVDAATHNVIGTVDVGAAGCDFPWRATMSPDEAYVYVGCRNSGNVTVIETAGGTIVTTVAGIGGADGIAFTRDGSHALVGSRWNSQIAIIDTDTYAVVGYTNLPGIVRSVATHPYLEIAYATCADGTIRVIDTATFDAVASIAVGSEPHDVAVSPDGQWVFVVDRYSAGLAVIDAATYSVYTTVTGLGNLTGVVVAPDGSAVYVMAHSTGVQVIDGATFQHVATIPGIGSTWQAAISIDGAELYVGNKGNQVPVIDTASYLVTDQITLPGSGARGIVSGPPPVMEGVLLSPLAQTNTGAPGAIVAHEETLVNATGATDSFDLTPGTHLWDTALSTGSVGPIGHGDAVTFTVYVTVPLGVDWYSTDSVVVTATSVTSPTDYWASALFTTQAYAPPQISVSPEWFTTTQYVGETTSHPLTIGNGTGVTLTFDILTGGGAGDSLEDNLATLNTNYQTVIDAIPNRYDFDEGETGYYIGDGGNDMYDGGNYLSTDVYTGYIQYSNNLIVDSDAFGDSGRYFTRKYPGLFLLVADIQNVGSFVISGNLGADGGGNADGTILQAEHYGSTYYGFVKRVYNAGDPSVNHLIIVADNPAADHTYATNTNDDYHEVFNLAPSSRLYYLLYAGSNGAYIDDSATLNIMETFLDALDLLPPAPWLSADPASGVVPTSDSVEVAVNCDAMGSQPGDYEAILAVESNDPMTPSVAIPVAMTVLPTADMGWVEGTVSDARTGDPLEATIVAWGQPYTVTSDPDTGYYVLWLTEGTYTLEAMADGYVPQTAVVDILAQQGIVQNIGLVLDAPVLEVTHEDMHVTQEVGGTTTRVMTITNAGPADLTFELAERDTTPGLASLDAYARTDREIAIMTAQLEAVADPDNEGSPTIARIPSDAFMHLQGTTHILAWTAYTDYYQEYQNTLNAIAQYTSYTLIETTDTDPGALAPLLADADVFLIPEQEYSDYWTLFNIGTEWADVLADFVSAGGTVVAMDHCNQTTGLVEGAGLMDVEFYDCVGSFYVEVVEPDHPLAKELPPTFATESGTGFYSHTGGLEIIQSQGYDWTVVAAGDIDAGHVVMMGFDFFGYNDAMARLLANAVLWYSSDVPWLQEEPVAGTVPGYSSITVQVSYDAAGMQPGDYWAEILIHSNDPYSGTVPIPVGMTVLPTTDMGAVAGIVYDDWTGLHMTATVELGDFYSMTASPDYVIWAPAGTYSLSAYSADYYTTTVSVTILAGETVTQDLPLEPALPRLEWAPEAVGASAVEGNTITQTLFISNTGPIPLEIALHELSPTLALRAPSPADLSGRAILYDRAHGEPSMWDYDVLVGDVISAGAVIVENWIYPIDASVLESYDVLWVNCCGSTNWTYGELNAVSDWLAEGGAVFVQGDGSAATMGPAGIFGITYQSGSSTSGTTTHITNHPISEGVDAVYVEYTHWYLVPGGEADIVVFDPLDQPHVVAQEQSGGKMVVVASEDFIDWYIGYDDNRLMANNILAWLARPGYVDVPWLSETPSGATIPGHDSVPITLGFDAGVLAPGVYEALVAIEHNDPGQADPAEVPVLFTVEERQAGLSITPLSQEGGARPGATAVYTWTLTNEGNDIDSFSLEVTGLWLATLSLEDTGPLGAGESIVFQLEVTVPISATLGMSDTTTITGTSLFDPDASATAAAVTFVPPPPGLYLPVVLKNS